MNLGTLCAFDFETSGELPEHSLQPWRVAQGKAWPTSLAWVRHVDGKPLVQGGVLDDETMPDAGRLDRAKAMATEMLEEVIEHKLTLGGWNTTFDVSWLLALGLEDLVSKVRFADGLMLWRHFFIEPEYELDRAKKRSYGLKTFVAENLPEFAGYNDEVDFHDRSVEARIKLNRYNIQDTVATYVGVRTLWNALSPAQQVAAAIEAQSIPLAAAANLMGLPVDVLATRELQASLHVTAARCLDELSPFGVTEKVVRSPKQLGDLLYDQWGLPILKENTGKKTGKISRATDKEVLHELAFKDPRARTLHHYREALGNCTKFADNILASVAYNEDGRTHPLMNIFSTYSGRATYSSQQGKNKAARPIGFALHQEKRGKLFRSVLIPPEDYDLAEFDAAGQEARWMAIQSGDESMMAMCLPGEDIHSFMGSRIEGSDYKEMIDRVRAHDYNAESARKLGKVTNLALAYRTSARRLRVKARVDYDIPMELPQAEHIRAVYLATYPGIPAYWKSSIAKTKRLGYAETLAGRRVRVQGNWAGNEAWSMEGSAINYPIQGTGADQKYLALAVLRSYLDAERIKFAFELHDGLFFFIPKAKTAKAMPTIKKMLDTLPYQRAWGLTPPIPMPFDAKVGGSWGALQDWRE
jgi:DNA polymerase-1